MGKHWVVDEAITQGKLHSFSWSKNDKCEMCRKQGTEVHHLFKSHGWKDVKSWTMESGRTEELREPT